jgi:hypothetical protein
MHNLACLYFATADKDLRENVVYRKKDCPTLVMHTNGKSPCVKIVYSKITLSLPLSNL